MRYGIFSDIHGNLEAMEAVFSAYKNTAIDQFICLGDIVGYGANPAECIDKLQKIDCKNIAGNHDWGVVGMFDTAFFNIYARQAIHWTQLKLDKADKEFLKNLPLTYMDRHLICVHGTLDEPRMFNYLLSLEAAALTFLHLDKNICFIGHTHIPIFFVKEKNRILVNHQHQIRIKPECQYICNVGSIGQPRDGNPQATYCIYDTEKNLVEIKRISYNITRAQNRIRRAKLPEFLATRLSQGR